MGTSLDSAFEKYPQGSWRIVQTRPTTRGPAFFPFSYKFKASTRAPPRGRAVAREVKPTERELGRCLCRLDMNNPPTTFGGIPERECRTPIRRLSDPPLESDAPRAIHRLNSLRYIPRAVRVLVESEYNPTLHDREEIQTI